MEKYGVFLYEIGDIDDLCVEEECAYFNCVDNATWYAVNIIGLYDENKYYIEVWEEDKEGLYGNGGDAIWASKSSGFYKE